MKKVLSFLSFENIAYLSVFFLGLLFVIRTPAIYFTDSNGYLEMSIYRSCGYPLFIAAHKILFGSSFDMGIIITQYLLNISAAYFLVQRFRKLVSLDKWLGLILFIIMLFPVFKGIFTANTILSESLCYPLYLFIIGNIFSGVAYQKHRYFYYAFGLTFVIVLVRGQFLFLIPALLAAILLAYFRSLLQWKTLLLAGVVVSIPFLAILTDINFHRIKHNHAITTPWTGLQIITIPLFTADENDDMIFETPEQQRYFRYIYSVMKQKKLLCSELPDDGKRIDFFFDHYVAIANGTIGNEGLNMFPADKTYDEKCILNDQMTTSMTVPLIKNNFKKWFAIYSGNFIKGFDSSKYFLLYLVILLLGVVTLFKKENLVSKIIILLTLLTIGNVALVAIAESTIGRYLFYNNWVLFAIILLLFQNKFYTKTDE